MVFAIARPSRDGKTRRACARGHFAPRVSRPNCAFRYALGPRPGQPRVRPTPRPPSPSPRRHRFTSFLRGVGGMLGCARSIPGSMRASGVPARWRSRGKGGRQDTKNRTGAHSGGACRRQGQTLVCSPDDTRHAACSTIAKIKSAMWHGAHRPYTAVYRGRESATIADSWPQKEAYNPDEGYMVPRSVNRGHTLRHEACLV